MNKVNFGETRIKIKPATRVPFVVTYQPRFQAPEKIFHENLNLLYTYDKVKDNFTSEPMVSFRATPKLCNYLVKTRLYPLERTVRSRKCTNNDVRFVKMFKIQIHFEEVSPLKQLKFTIVLSNS